MHKSLILLVLLSFSTSLLALGTGQPQLHSSLGDPLMLELPLNSVDRFDNDQLNISIADNHVYSMLGFDYSHTHRQLQFDLVRDENNKPSILITTEHAFKEPYLHFLLRIETPHSTLVRDIPVLLDTPRLEHISSVAKQY